MPDPVTDKPAMRKTGRPKKPKERQRSKIITVKMTLAEDRQTTSLVKQSHFKSRSAFMRSRVLADEQDACSPRVIVVRTDWETIRLLKSCANNLNQQTRKLNALGLPPNRADHGAVLDFLRQFLAEQEKRLLI